MTERALSFVKPFLAFAWFLSGRSWSVLENRLPWPFPAAAIPFQERMDSSPAIEIPGLSEIASQHRLQRRLDWFSPVFRLPIVLPCLMTSHSWSQSDETIVVHAFMAELPGRRLCAVGRDRGSSVLALVAGRLGVGAPMDSGP
jgi:hypothetical protein